MYSWCFGLELRQNSSEAEQQGCLYPPALSLLVFSSSGLGEGWRGCSLLLQQSPESDKRSWLCASNPGDIL